MSKSSACQSIRLFQNATELITPSLVYRQREMSEPAQFVAAKNAPETPLAEQHLTSSQTGGSSWPHSAPNSGRNSWIVGLTSFLFIVLQSACTAVMAISGVRVLIGLGALAAAAGLHRPASGFHADAIRIPMMVVAVGGSIVNLYVIWRIRSLRGRASSQWRARPVAARKLREERFQIALAVVTLILVAAEYATHLIVHDA